MREDKALVEDSHFRSVVEQGFGGMGKHGLRFWELMSLVGWWSLDGIGSEMLGCLAWGWAANAGGGEEFGEAREGVGLAEGRREAWSRFWRGWGLVGWIVV